MRDILLQPRTVIEGLAGGSGGVTRIRQDEEYHVDVTGFGGVGAILEVTSLSLPMGATLSFSLQCAPTPDEDLFVNIAPPIVFDGIDVSASSTPYLIKSICTPQTGSLAARLRWDAQLSAGATGLWRFGFRARLIPGRSRFFAPTDISGIAAWFRSDMGITKDSSNLVTTWADQSGLGRDLTSSGGNRPKWQVNQINRWPAVYFDQSLGAKLMATSTFALGTYTLLLVTTGQSANGFFFTRSTSGVTIDTLYGSTGDTTDVSRGGTLSAYNHIANWGQFGTSTAKLIVQRFDGTHAGHTVTLNTTPIATSSLAAGDPGTATTTDKFVLAARDDGFLGATINVAEAILYNRALSTDELAIVQEYLRRRYGLY